VATIHRTTLVPTKLELLAGWLPEQPWWRGGAHPELARAGGFRLDDPAGAVGIEFLLVTDGPQDAYCVPLTYRGAPLDGAGTALIGTTEHGVLGRRWVYDGVQDPVLVAALDEFVHGRAEAQQQSSSDTPDPSVTVTGTPGTSVEVLRVLGGRPVARGYVEAGWTRADGTSQRGAVALLR
jgi:hypothetical protein